MVSVKKIGDLFEIKSVIIPLDFYPSLLLTPKWFSVRTCEKKRNGDEESSDGAVSSGWRAFQIFGCPAK